MKQSPRLDTLMYCRGVTELFMAGGGLRYHLITALNLTIRVPAALLTIAVADPAGASAGPVTASVVRGGLPRNRRSARRS